MQEVIGIMFGDQSMLLKGILFYLWVSLWFPIYFVGDLIMLPVGMMARNNYYPIIIITKDGPIKIQYVHLLAGCILEWIAIYVFIISKFRINVTRYEKRRFKEEDDILDS